MYSHTGKMLCRIWRVLLCCVVFVIAFCYLGRRLMTAELYRRQMSWSKWTARSRNPSYVSYFSVTLFFDRVIFLVPGCGWLFEVWLRTFSSWTGWKTFSKYAKRAAQSEHKSLERDEVDELVEHEKNYFWVSYFQHLNHMSNYGKLQQFEMALVLDGKGLSDTGRDILSKLDVCVSHGTFLNYKGSYIRDAQLAIQ